MRSTLSMFAQAQAKEKAEMESVGMWEETGLVFTTTARTCGP